MPANPDVVIQTPCPVQPNCVCSTEVIVDGEVVIPPQKPEKERILEFRVSVEVTDWQVINTPLGHKVIVSGVVHIGIEYVANVPDQAVHFAHFDIPWHTFFLCAAELTNVTACIEYADFQQIDPRHIAKLVVLYVCGQGV